MSLQIPTVGSEPGPQFAYEINSSLSLIDSHDHTPGRGVQITPSGLNINANLPINGNFITNIGGLTLTAQGSLPTNNTVYESGVDLYFVDGVGNNVRITQSGGIAGSPGSIANLTSPASASYVAGSKTFVWQSDTNIAANMDFASAVFRNITPNSTNGVTVGPVPSLGSSYSLVLPTIPASTSFMTLDTSGNISGSISTNAGITGGNIAAATIMGSNIAAATVTKANQVAVGQQTSASSGNFSTTSAILFGVTNLTVTITTSGRPVMLRLSDDGTHSGSVVSASTGASTTGGEIAFFNGVLIVDESNFNLSTGGAVTYRLPLSTFSAMDNSVVGTPGTYTYTVKAKYTGSGSNISVINAVLVAYEL